MAWRLARSLVTLRDEVNTRWPGRDKSSDGSIGDAAHAARKSDHNPDSRGVVRAIDIDDNDARTSDEGIGRVIAETIRTRKDTRVTYLIYHGQMVSSYRSGVVPAWTWRPYNGPNKHMQHLHVSVTADDALADSAASWGIRAPVITQPTPQPRTEDDVTPEQDRLIREIHGAIGRLDQGGAGQQAATHLIPWLTDDGQAAPRDGHPLISQQLWTVLRHGALHATWAGDRVTRLEGAVARIEAALERVASGVGALDIDSGVLAEAIRLAGTPAEAEALAADIVARIGRKLNT